jgi:hypothetical protein
MTIVSIVAVLLSPIIAVLISMLLQNRRSVRTEKMQVFNALIGNRNNSIAIESVRALNMIDVVFHDASKVRGLWHECYDMLSNKGLDNELGYKLRQKKNLEMITEMAKTLGYGKAITHLDVDRAYSPIGLENQNQKGTQIADELLRVFKGTQSIEFAQMDGTGKKPAKTTRTISKKRN